MTPKVAGASGATYTIEFRTSATGALAAGGGTIKATAAPGTKLPNCALVTDLSAGTDPANLCAGGMAPAATMTLTETSTIGPGDQVQMVFTGATNAAVVGAPPYECLLPPMLAGKPATTSWHRGRADRPGPSRLGAPLIERRGRALNSLKPADIQHGIIAINWEEHKCLPFRSTGLCDPTGGRHRTAPPLADGCPALLSLWPLSLPPACSGWPGPAASGPVWALLRHPYP